MMYFQEMARRLTPRPIMLSALAQLPSVTAAYAEHEKAGPDVLHRRVDVYSHTTRITAPHHCPAPLPRTTVVNPLTRPGKEDAHKITKLTLA